MKPNEIYPDGYWKIENAMGQPVDPYTLKPPPNVTMEEGRAITHVAFPPSKN
jgi:hypothetical protein